MMIGRLEVDGVVVSDEPIAVVVLLDTLVGTSVGAFRVGAAVGASVGDNVHTGPASSQHIGS